MRPNALESLRGVQAAIAEILLPELQTMFAQDAAQTLQMLLESLAGEWDTAAEHLVRDNQAVVAVLGDARQMIAASYESNARLAPLVNDIGGALQGDTPSLALSALQARNRELMSMLDRLLAELDDLAAEADSGGQPAGALMELRARIYGHLRQAAVRGWSVWDMMSFRERMARVRGGA